MASQIYNRFDPEKGYENHRFVPGRGLQSAELNEIQSKSAHDLRQVADAIFKDGDIIRDAQIQVNPDTGVVRCDSGAVYLRGSVRGLEPATLTIPVVGTLSVGVKLIEDVITHLEDPELLDPATGTRNYNQPGAERTRVRAQWALDDGAGGFYPVYTVVDGTVQAKEPPPNLDGVTQAIARYDRDSSGGTYVVSGMRVTQLADADATHQIYSIGEGRARVFGFPVEFRAGVRTALEAIPDLKAIFNEPHLSAGTTAQRIEFDRTPAVNITEVTIQARKTVTLTRGPTSGGQDVLPDTSVLLIASVVQGGTTYVQGTDYLLTAGKVNWSPAGSEPATGSTYQVTYEYLTNVTPTLVDDTGFTVTGAVAGSLVQVSYSQKLPRIDALCLSSSGMPVWIKGVAAEFSPQSPRVPDDLLQIASVYQTWTAARSIRTDGVRLVPMPALASVEGKFDYLLQLIAQQRLESSIHTREGGTKKGLFTDPFIDDSQRDNGTVQNAAIVRGLLMLPIAAQVHYPNADVQTPATLAYSASITLRQDLRTGSQQINPYMAFAPIPANVTLVPAVDRWTNVVSESASPITQRFVVGSGDQASETSSTRNVLIGVTRTEAETVRSIPVTYSISGFGPGEALQALTFDGVSVLSGTPVANSAGVVGGSFTIPAGLPTGTKNVVAVGAGGSRGAASFSSQGTLERQTFQQQTTVTETRWWSPPPPPEIVWPPILVDDGDMWPSRDPIAQTFTLESTQPIAGVEIFFAARPTTKVSLQIRSTAVGFPTQNVLVEASMAFGDVNVGGAPTRFNFQSPVTLLGGQEYAVVVLCDDAVGALSIAELGKFDSNAQQWVSTQAYNVGVMLSSANASTWTAHQDRDLTFRMLRADYSQTSRTIALGSVAVENATDLLVMGFVDRPSSATSAAFRLTIPGGTTVDVADGQPVQLPSAVTGQVQISAVLGGTSQASPTLFPGTQLVAGTVATSANYVTRAVPGGASVRVKVIYEAQVPSGSAVDVAYKGPDLGDTWTAIGSPTTRPVDDGFIEFIHEATGINEASVQVQLTLTGTSAARPVVRDLRVIVL